MGVRLRRRFGFHLGRAHLLRGRTPRPRRVARARFGAAAGGDRASARRTDARHRRHDPARPGRPRPRGSRHLAVHPGSARGPARPPWDCTAPRTCSTRYPERLRRSGVLVVGPNRAFLHYIAQVLPSLGEGGIEQARWRPDGLAGYRAPSRPKLAVLKGDARMADVLRRAVLAHVAKPTEDLVAIVGTKRYRVGAHHLRRYVDDARRALGDGLHWSIGRERLRTQVAEDVRRQREDAGGAPSDADTARVARAAGVTRFPRRRVAGAVARPPCCRGSTATRTSCAGARRRR